MKNQPYAEFYVPLLLLIATPFAAFGLPSLSSWVTPDIALLIAALIFLIAGVLGYRATKAKIRQSRGGRGGNAESFGYDNQALGGDGGPANEGNGGDGGDAKVHGSRSTAKGGRGGAG